MSRLRKLIANNVNPEMHETVQKMVSNPAENPNEDKSESILLAKRLIAELPISPSNTITYALASAITNGELGETDGDFQTLVQKTNEFLRTKGFLISVAKKKRLAGPNNLYTDKYTDVLYTNDYLDMNKDLNKANGSTPNNTSRSEKEEHISNSFALAKDLINGLPIVPRYDLMSQMAQDIERGDFDDISSKADAKSHWDAWLSRARQILKARNIILS